MAYQTTIADDETVSVDESDDDIECACDYGSPGCYEHYEVADDE